MNQVTLGGDRLGSGKKMKVDLHGFERSTHDLGYIWRSTMAPGTLVPFMNEIGLPGDTFDIHLNCDIKTHPTIGPLFGSFKVQLDVFMVPWRLYISTLHNNTLNIGLNMASVKLPKVKLWGRKFNASVSDFDNWQVNPSCIFSYLGIRGIGAINAAEDEDVQQRKFNAISWLAYHEIYKNYFSNKQEEEGVVISASDVAFPTTVTGISIDGVAIVASPAIALVGANAGDLVLINYAGTVPDLGTIVFNTTNGDVVAADAIMNPVSGGGTISGMWNGAVLGNRIVVNWNYINANTLNPIPNLRRFPLSDIDDMRAAILQEGFGGEFDVNNAAGAVNLAPYDWVLALNDVNGDLVPNIVFNQEGLLVKTYQSDLFNNWLSTDWIDGVGGINEITAIDTSGGSFNIDTLNLSKKVYDMLNRIAVSGGSYNDWLGAVYDQEPRRGAESPVYMGGLIKELVFQEVVSNSESTNTEGAQPLGTLAGKGVMGSKHKGGDVIVRCDEPCYIMGIVSLMLV